MDQENLRNKLIQVIDSGLSAKSISMKVNIASDYLSRFKNNHICLCREDAERLENYLDKVVIP